MSYILDALKRADAERGRGAVPGLHTRQMTSPALSDSPDTGRRAGLAVVVLVAVAALGAVAAGAWFLLRPAGPVPVAIAPVVAQPALRQLPVPMPTPMSTPTSTPPTVAAVPVLPAQKTVAKLPPKSPPESAIPAPAAPAAPAAIPLLSELPEAIRHQLPPLVINGSVYSSNPSQRLLLVNNLVLSQGSQAAPEVTLEEIRPKSSVFSFRGSRFQLVH